MVVVLRCPSPLVHQDRPLFEDEDAKAFYQSLPDLRLMVPLRFSARVDDDDGKDDDEVGGPLRAVPAPRTMRYSYG